MAAVVIFVFSAQWGKNVLAQMATFLTITRQAVSAVSTKLKVKNDHRSKLSNLGNWKEEAEASSFQLLKLEICCDDHSSLSSTTAA